MRRPNYEVDETTFPADAYTVQGYRGVAWRVYGWELEGVFPEYETECSCFGEDVHCRFCDGSGKVWIQEDEPEEVRTGRVICVMVGDDRRFTFDPDELTPLDDLDYCASCGQVGCTHDGRERE
jgi:hypothetical protein